MPRSPRELEAQRQIVERLGRLAELERHERHVAERDALTDRITLVELQLARLAIGLLRAHEVAAIRIDVTEVVRDPRPQRERLGARRQPLTRRDQEPLGAILFAALARDDRQVHRHLGREQRLPGVQRARHERLATRLERWVTHAGQRPEEPTLGSEAARIGLVHERDQAMQRRELRLTGPEAIGDLGLQRQRVEGAGLILDGARQLQRQRARVPRMLEPQPTQRRTRRRQSAGRADHATLDARTHHLVQRLACQHPRPSVHIQYERRQHARELVVPERDRPIHVTSHEPGGDEIVERRRHVFAERRRDDRLRDALATWCKRRDRDQRRVLLALQERDPARDRVGQAR